MSLIGQGSIFSRVPLCHVVSPVRKTLLILNDRIKHYLAVSSMLFLYEKTLCTRCEVCNITMWISPHGYLHPVHKAFGFSYIAPLN